jgi:dihydrodipicolinate synthase/N-acetylneuraminate lyase
MNDYPMPPSWVLERLETGLVIPAHPLALIQSRRLDERRQRALSRYYHAAGAGGLAVGVHTTQFSIRNPEHGLLAPVLEIARSVIRDCDEQTGRRTVCIAGVCGLTAQALKEAQLARELGYHAGLLSLGALSQADDQALVGHCREVAREIPLIGFYLQPAVGGRVLRRQFWREFARIPNVLAIKIAPFNRYQTLDVILGLAEAGRPEVALYTGNDDHILLDLLTEFRLGTGEPLRMRGGLLGHWAFWTSRAVEMLEQCRCARDSRAIPADLLSLAAQVTDSNAAVFDAAHNFAGCIPGIHQVLQRQGLLENSLCLDPRETLSPGQVEEIERVCQAYPHLNDDLFVEEHLDEWLN